MIAYLYFFLMVHWLFILGQGWLVLLEMVLVFVVQLLQLLSQKVSSLGRNKRRKIMNLLSVDDSIFIFLSYGTLVVHIGSGMAGTAGNAPCDCCLAPSASLSEGFQPGSQQTKIILRSEICETLWLINWKCTIQCVYKNRKLRFNPRSLKIEKKNHELVISGW